MEALGQAGRAMPPRPRVQAISREHAARFIAEHAAWGHWIDIDQDSTTRKAAYKRAAARLHPDNRETGNHELFLKLQEAMEVLEG